MAFFNVVPTHRWFVHGYKKNYMSECISLCFLILRNDITQPHLLTTEPSEHANALARGMIREFTVKNLIYLTAKLDIFWTAIVKGALKLSRNALQGQKGYASTLSVPTTSVAATGKGTAGPVDINDQSDLFPSVAKQIWTGQLFKSLNLSSASGHHFLRDICLVREENPLMSQFQNSDSPKELVEQCEAMF